MVSSPDEEMAAVVARVWERMRPTAVERLDRVIAAVRALAEDALSPEERSAAIGDAHKLTGALGTYGHPDGSEIARRAERALEDGAPTGVEPTLLGAELEELRERISR